MATGVDKLVIGGMIHDKTEDINLMVPLVVAELTAAAAAGATPTKAEFDKVVADAVTICTSFRLLQLEFNTLVALLEANGVVLESSTPT